MKRSMICMLAVFLAAGLLAGCHNGGSNAATYNTCRITASGAIFSSDQAEDMKQCWNINPTSDETNAMSQCGTLVANYVSSRYVTSVGESYEVASSPCP